MMTIKQIPVLALTALLLAGCGAQDAPAPATSPEAGVAAAKAADATAAGPFQASGATIRKPPGGRDVTAGFITITNPGAPDRLIAASTPVAASVELHTHTMADGMMQMRKVDGFDLPAGGTLNLASGGDHLMPFGVKSDLGADGPVPVTLTFQNAGAVEVMFAVGQEAGATDEHGHGSHGHDSSGHGEGK